MKVKNILLVLLAIILIALVISKCNCRKHESQLKNIAFINPPIQSADVPFTSYTIEASIGDTIVYNSGSVLIFPSNAFADKKGNVITGKVDIKYREFTTPIDFYLSGIPMDYDSAGVKYVFESAGMCEVQAFKNGEPVFVNKNNKPEINIASRNNDPAQNLYFLDTVNKKWVFNGKDQILDMNTITNNSSEKTNDKSQTISAPIKPGKPEGDMPIITVKIDSSSFKELFVYHNLKFQLDRTANNFNAKDANEEWSNFELKKGKNKNLYNIHFSNKKKSVEYLARPVLEGIDYDNAIKIYQRDIATYKAKITALKDAYLKDSLENIKIARENEKTIQLNKIISAKNDELEIERKKIESYNQTVRLLRSFKIENFGIWNCDRPMELEKYVNIITNYVQKNGKPIKLSNSFLFIKNFKGLFILNENEMSFPINRENMVVGTVDGYFAYINYNEFKQLKMSESTKSQTFPMNIVSKENNNYEFIKRLVNQ